MTRTWTIGIGVVALLACACSDVIFGNGERESEKRDVSGFTKVKSSGSIDVAVEYAEDFALTVSLDSNLLPELETRVVGDTLVIEHEPDFADMVAGPHVKIRMPALLRAELAGSGEVEIEQPTSEHALSLVLSGSGKIAYSGSAPSTNVRLAGSGDVVLDGKSEQVKLDLSGSGDIDARKYESSDGILDLSGSGTIRAALSKTAAVDLSGSGDVYLYGDPEITRLSIAGSGDVHEE